MAGMLSHLVATGAQRKVVLLHADTAPDTFALRAQVTADLGQLLDGTLAVWFEQPSATPVPGEHEGLMDVNAVELPADAQYYLCGPLPFMQAVRSSLITRGVPAKDIQYEVFGPDLWLADFE
ncbi:ferredoxin reductase domain-containing protein [Kocuria sp. U4B]